jgi:hypothetical protein
MLYLPGRDTYPPQINDGSTSCIGGDTDEFSRHGLWNEELNDRWLQEADFILIEAWRYDADWKDLLHPPDETFYCNSSL